MEPEEEREREGCVNVEELERNRMMGDIKVSNLVTSLKKAQFTFLQELNNAHLPKRANFSP